MKILDNIEINQFPSTRYQGSKRKILPWIYSHLKELKFNTALDAFGGTGSVSLLLKRMGKEVTYNDKLKFNYIIGKAIIQNQNVFLTNEDIDNLFQWIKSNNSETFIRDTFKGIYYLNNENKWLDSVNNGILNMNHYSGQTLEYKKSIAYYGLFQACLVKRPYNLFHRNNLSMRTADVERGFGNKVSWDKSFYLLFEKFVDEANLTIFNSGKRCKAINQSALSINDMHYDLVYIDPPYLSKNEKNESANYLKCYHFLEGLARYKQWANLIDYDSHNLRFKNINYDEGFLSETNKELFEQLIHKFKKSIIVFSYKSNGTPSIRSLVKIMKKYKKNVYTRSMPYNYVLRTASEQKNKLSREVIIIGK